MPEQEERPEQLEQAEPQPEMVETAAVGDAAVVATAETAQAETPQPETVAETALAAVATAPAPAPSEAYPSAHPVPQWGAQQLFPLVPAAEPKPKRHFPWRWLGALVTAAAVGTGCAFAVMAPQRTDLPGLATPSDGRYVFAPLSLPTLAPGQLPPGDPSNKGGQHLADIRELLLPAPQEAVADHALKLSAGWLSETDTLKLTWSTSAQLDFGQYGWRHTAAESWKTPDGAETKIYLMQFSSDLHANLALATLDDMTGVPAGAPTPSFTVGFTSLTYYEAAHGSLKTWYGIAALHDTVLEIVYTAPSSVGVTPFRQEFSLQAELLE
jgi:hypothetical protein